MTVISRLQAQPRLTALPGPEELLPCHLDGSCSLQEEIPS